MTSIISGSGFATTVVFALTLINGAMGIPDFWERKAESFPPRVGHSTVFTGKEIIVWGGPIWPYFSDLAHGSGAVYDSGSDTWKSTAVENAPKDRYFHTALWTGKEMIVWGGLIPDDMFGWGDGGRYDPRTDTWRPIDEWCSPESVGPYGYLDWNGDDHLGRPHAEVVGSITGLFNIDRRSCR